MSEPISEPGIYRISAERYHADCCPVPSLSSSIARELLAHSPFHAWWNHPKLNPAYAPDEDEKFDLGTALHAYVLEGRGSEVLTGPLSTSRAHGDKATFPDACAWGCRPTRSDELKRKLAEISVTQHRLASRRALLQDAVTRLRVRHAAPARPGPTRVRGTGSASVKPRSTEVDRCHACGKPFRIPLGMAGCLDCPHCGAACANTAIGEAGERGDEAAAERCSLNAVKEKC